ncbi:UDP-3-O-(3-hydroxymyristoyl)glucosamine N-acyltransferase [uncultured Rikenella sp.]|uniref:UDP-3-O-(3-hydroxymyristoyl)glucosamine N-acyltransferase n=1 Tax=uncultured Rikenella sp. TaxID=368003 RepID=UPI0025D24C42|nr:UDP-3-O-(3-hydroxymyristoyl)glucosamine N-acyltransferase [uncultured Rikenella sp.]
MMQFTAEMIAGFLGGTVEGNGQAAVGSVAKIEEAKAGDLVFLSNPKYEEFLYQTGATIAIVNADLIVREALPEGLTLVRVENAYKAFASLLDLYVANKPKKTGISPLASIHSTATVGEGVYVGEYAVIGEGAVVKAGAQIWPQVYVGDGVRVGERTILYPGVKVYEACELGDDVIVHGGTVIGGDGFGFAPTDDGSFQKIPQIGNVVIEDGVEIGSNCAIDRATMGSTRIKRGAKLDNLIQIAHNVVIGENTVMAAQVGIAGSTKVGRNVMMGGQVGVVGHIAIADGVKIGSQSGIPNNILTPGVTVFGSPAYPGLEGHRIQASVKQLPELRKQVAELSRQLKALEARLGERAEE